MLLVPRVLFHPLVIINTLEHDLAEAVEVGQIGHLMVEESAHQAATTGRVVDLVPSASQ